MKKQSLLFFIALSTVSIAHAQQVIPLYPGKAPGSENWTWKERDIDGGVTKMDVTEPTLTAFLPANPNGIAVIIAPGGAFHFLAFKDEGIAVAKRLNEKGIMAFVLKYRLVHEDPAHPYLAKMFSGTFENATRIMDSTSAPVLPLMLQDGLTAVKFVRENAAKYKIDPTKIGFMGFSAGGTVTMSVVCNATDESRPNFAAPIYGYEPLVIRGEVPTARTPLFVCAASDDVGVQPSNSIQFYSRWLEAKQPVELHMYAKGGHGFHTKKQNLAVDTWFERFFDWLFLEYTPKK